mgnify:CR=1 FL=1
MDELDILKKDWHKKGNNFKQLDENQIYAMLKKNSSSIVKWILIISIIEFVVLRLVDVYFLFDEKYTNLLETYHLNTIETVIDIINYTVLLYFIYQFYKNFKTIKSTDSVKKLTKSIIKTRKTVKQYVIFNLGLVFVYTLIGFKSQIKYDPVISIHYENYYLEIILIASVVILVFLFLIWFFYKILYGFLLEKLNKNYKDLKKLDV